MEEGGLNTSRKSRPCVGFLWNKFGSFYLTISTCILATLTDVSAEALLRFAPVVALTRRVRIGRVRGNLDRKDPL